MVNTRMGNADRGQEWWENLKRVLAAALLVSFLIGLCLGYWLP
ncbi:hypothetical protein MTAT_26260 [Moorella thermoacetica]|uniref:Uncharacterized protein n=1 Tax=Neomoorella thermoacetica TaxID=1525 RepID=A0AAC9MU25_NEOTH|nr:hypothetical protein Maut_00608 [Moorella thermoacetica]TYL08962.1 hypothetical protein MTAT_26260 [Moorella thermoacetica]